MRPQRESSRSASDDWPRVALAPWVGPVDPDHPDANFLADVATTSLADPMPTLERLSRALDLPVGALARYVLAKWTTAGSEAVLAAGPSAITRVRELVDRLADLEDRAGAGRGGESSDDQRGLDGATPGAAATTASDDAAGRRAVLADLVEQVQWLAHGVDDPGGTYPGGGADPVAPESSGKGTGSGSSDGVDSGPAGPS
ncbi:MAG TPA: DUF6027 family protein [Nitriliruptoraceae bacterium]|nr:DUF6027 family protein [Nitriliruptoraceae bacterium]